MSHKDSTAATAAAALHTPTKGRCQHYLDIWQDCLLLYGFDICPGHVLPAEVVRSWMTREPTSVTIKLQARHLTELHRRHQALLTVLYTGHSSTSITNVQASHILHYNRYSTSTFTAFLTQNYPMRDTGTFTQAHHSQSCKQITNDFFMQACNVMYYNCFAGKVQYKHLHSNMEKCLYCTNKY